MDVNSFAQVKRAWALLKVTQLIGYGAHIPFICHLSPKDGVYVFEEVLEYCSSWMTSTVADTNDLEPGTNPWNSHVLANLKYPHFSV